MSFIPTRPPTTYVNKRLVDYWWCSLPAVCKTKLSAFASMLPHCAVTWGLNSHQMKRKIIFQPKLTSRLRLPRIAWARVHTTLLEMSQNAAPATKSNPRVYIRLCRCMLRVYMRPRIPRVLVTPLDPSWPPCSVPNTCKIPGSTQRSERSGIRLRPKLCQETTTEKKKKKKHLYLGLSPSEEGSQMNFLALLRFSIQINPTLKS